MIFLRSRLLLVALKNIRYILMCKYTDIYTHLLFAGPSGE